MSLFFFIGLFAMCKLNKIRIFVLETLTFWGFRGIIYSNIFIVLPHNADYVVFLILHPHKSHSLHLSAMGVTVFYCVNSCRIYITVTKNVCKSYNVFLQ